MTDWDAAPTSADDLCRLCRGTSRLGDVPCPGCDGSGRVVGGIPPLTVRVLYSCEGCGSVDVPVLVPARGAEGVVAWMRQTTEIVTRDHRARHHFCRARKLSSLKVPMAGTAKVGGPTCQ